MAAAREFRHRFLSINRFAMDWGAGGTTPSKVHSRPHCGVRRQSAASTALWNREASKPMVTEVTQPDRQSAGIQVDFDAISR
jgi:hypothetical protein